MAISALVLASACLLVAFLAASQWVSAGDNTCGALYTPRHWNNDELCRGRLLWRAVVTAFATTSAIALAFLVARAGHRRDT